jgi:hypothetical protein
VIYEAPEVAAPRCVDDLALIEPEKVARPDAARLRVSAWHKNGASGDRLVGGHRR